MNILRPFILSLFASAFIVVLWQGIKKTDILKLQTIKIVGASPSTEIRVRNLMTLKAGDSLWNKSVENQVELIKRDPWVESAEVRRLFPQTLIVEVRERTPFAVIGDAQGRFKYLDGNNNVIDNAEPGKIGGYPILMGRDLHEKNDLRAQAVEILKSLPDEGLISRHDISDLRFDEERGFQVRLSKTGMLVDIGKDNIPLHIDRARRVVQYLDHHNINASRVDSDYSKKVLVKVRKDR